MEIVDIHEAGSRLAKLVGRALEGVDVILARAGKPVVRLVPIRRDDPPREGGQWKGRVRVADDFDATPEEFAVGPAPAGGANPENVEPERDGRMTTMTISLPDEMKAFVETQVIEEGYASAGEYFRALVREAQRRRARQALEAKLLEGLQGPAVEMTREDWDSIGREAAGRHTRK